MLPAPAKTRDTVNMVYQSEVSRDLASIKVKVPRSDSIAANPEPFSRTQESALQTSSCVSSAVQSKSGSPWHMCTRRHRQDGAANPETTWAHRRGLANKPWYVCTTKHFVPVNTNETQLFARVDLRSTGVNEDRGPWSMHSVMPFLRSTHKPNHIGLIMFTYMGSWGWKPQIQHGILWARRGVWVGGRGRDQYEPRIGNIWFDS